MPYEPDFEREDALMAQAEEVAYAREAPAYRSCRPQPCPSCAALWPVVDELQAMGRAAILETQMGGGVHAIRVWLDEGHVLANEECFSFYDDDDDEEGNDHTFYDSNDPPNAHQQAVLINIAIANHELRRSNMNAIERALAQARAANDPWRDDPDYPSCDWRDEVRDDATRLGYLDWVRHRRENDTAYRELP